MGPILEPFITRTQVLLVQGVASTLGSMQMSINKTAFAARLNNLLDERGIPGKFEGRQVAVGKLFGVSQKGARKWLEGEGLPTLEKCIEIASWAGVHTEWLVSGRGPKEVSEEPPERLLEELPTDVKQDTFNFLEFTLQKRLSGEQLARYLRWIDRIRNNPPGG